MGGKRKVGGMTGKSENGNKDKKLNKEMKLKKNVKMKKIRFEK